MVTLHGFTGTTDSWQLIAEQLALSWLHLPLLGHDPAVPPGTSTSFTAEADRLAAQIRQAGGDRPVVLAGYSLGARVALVLALRHPQLIERLVLVGCHPGLESETERSERRAADRRWIRRLRDDGIEAFVDAWQRLPLWASQQGLPAERLAEQRRTRLDHHPEGLAVSLEVLGLAEMPDFWTQLNELEMPVDLIVGALDEKFEAIAERMLSRLPAGRLWRVPGCGHNPLIDNPEALTGVLTQCVEVT